ncbi:MAG TPA: hypothetical protein VMY39_05680 [Planctomycetota bacterium]|nr:hypothetical protein [Planctomycetota bacterium]
MTEELRHPGVHVLQQTARYIETHYPEAKVYCRWPTRVLLDRPVVGYVSRRIAVATEADAPELGLAVFDNSAYGGGRRSLARRYTLTPLETFEEGLFKVEVVRLDPRRGVKAWVDWILPAR